MTRILHIFILTNTILLLFSCSKHPISLNYTEENLSNKETRIEYEIENNTNHKYAFYVPSSELVSVYIKDNDNLDVQYSSPIFINNRIPKNKIDSFVIELKKDSVLAIKLQKEGLKVDKFAAKNYRIQKNNRIILLPNQTAKFTRKFTFSKFQLMESGGYVLFDKSKNYTIQTKIKFDSVIIKELLTKSDLDSLRKNKIEIFYGSLSTKKQKLKI
jgi:hypothetical protein